jgi:hypothetical protein
MRGVRFESSLLTLTISLLSLSGCGGDEPAKKPSRTAVDVPPPTTANQEPTGPAPASSPEPKKKIPECQSDPDPGVAKREFQIGLEAFENANYSLAAESFTRSYVRSCSPSVLYNLGTTYEKVGDSAGALEAFELYLERQTNGAHLDEVKKRVELLRQRTSR